MHIFMILFIVGVCAAVTSFVTTVYAAFVFEFFTISVVTFSVTAIVSIVAIGTVASLAAAVSVVISRCTMLVLV